ncbi:3-dehydroquinate synthase II family protein [Phycicoccus jejuensis]|uniref:3-dehydroquinate synthase II family protein n=1 Tax=Phycicoccus jejuensis TaxID=367299 RepID=UPI0004C39084|nr:3-dehydroquinate synthase II family protein [Phycicoccus jejuensis]
MSTTTRLCWLDLREATSRDAIVEEALHQGIDGLVAAHPSELAGLPPSIDRVLLSEEPVTPGTDLGVADVVVAPMTPTERQTLEAAHPDVRFGVYVDVADAPTLEDACRAASTQDLTVIRFRDPTKIPLEIVLAAADACDGSVVTMAGDLEEAQIIYTVLEHGSDGVALRARAVGEATALRAAALGGSDPVKLDELRVVRTTHVGMGERACIDTCSYLGLDEGILVGSTSKGQVLCVSETHPLPYMPTRPFRVNAGAIHSYTLGENGRTRYLSELRAGDRVTAVRTDGSTRLVTVGRVKIESRPLISIDAESSDGRAVNLILQHDWHVRVLGPGAEVLNSTELRPGHIVLGHLPTADRHVGYPIREFCREQ